VFYRAGFAGEKAPKFAHYRDPLKCADPPGRSDAESHEKPVLSQSGTPWLIGG
jgi:hypothetical protein